MKAPRKNVAFRLQCIADTPIESINRTATGLPSVNTLTLRVLCGRPGSAAALLKEYTKLNDEGDASGAKKLLVGAAGACGTAFGAFREPLEGLKACAALDALCETAAIEKLLSGFIVPLQARACRRCRPAAAAAAGLAFSARLRCAHCAPAAAARQADAVRAGKLSGKSSDRVHCSLNINTETGRLSARRPSLQNQPALEKDRYGIRKSFKAEPGNVLIVADYGQLELRLLVRSSSRALPRIA